MKKYLIALIVVLSLVLFIRVYADFDGGQSRLVTFSNAANAVQNALQNLKQNLLDQFNAYKQAQTHTVDTYCLHLIGATSSLNDVYVWGGPAGVKTSTTQPAFCD
jgi:hypothetical protein